MSSRCNDILLSSSKNKVGFYLQQALDELNIHLDTACSKYQGEEREGGMGKGGEREGGGVIEGWDREWRKRWWRG